jgi:hypothetical protein
MHGDFCKTHESFALHFNFCLEPAWLLLFFLSKKVNKKDQFKKRRLQSTVHSRVKMLFLSP